MLILTSSGSFWTPTRYPTGSIPIVDADHRPLGIVTANDVVKWLAEIFPEAVLNLRPGDKLKRPFQVDSG